MTSAACGAGGARFAHLSRPQQQQFGHRQIPPDGGTQQIPCPVGGVEPRGQLGQSGGVGQAGLAGAGQGQIGGVAQAGVGEFVVGPLLRGFHHAQLAAGELVQVAGDLLAQGQAVLAQPLVGQAGMPAGGVQGFAIPERGLAVAYLCTAALSAEAVQAREAAWLAGLDGID